MNKPTQERMYSLSRDKTLEATALAGWMMGLVPDSRGKFCKHPLTDDEVLRIASSNKPTAVYFKGRADKIKQERGQN